MLRTTSGVLNKSMNFLLFRFYNFYFTQLFLRVQILTWYPLGSDCLLPDNQIQTTYTFYYSCLIYSKVTIISIISAFRLHLSVSYIEGLQTGCKTIKSSSRPFVPNFDFQILVTLTQRFPNFGARTLIQERYTAVKTFLF